MKDFKSEFELFLKSDIKTLPPQKAQNIQSLIAQQLKYETTPFLFLLAKYFLLQFCAGVLTLAVCPQFGVGPIGGGHGITQYFMQYGMWACGIFCALFFFTLSHLFAFYFLATTEINRLSKNKIWIAPIVTSTSFLILMLIGQVSGKTVSNLDMFFTFEYQIAWILSGFIAIQILFSCKKYFQRSLFS